AWAARRLAAPRVRAGDWPAVIGGHLGLSGEDRTGAPSAGGQDRRNGETALDHLAATENRSEAAADHLADTAEGLEAMAGLSPVTHGCLGFHLWRMPDPAPVDPPPPDPRAREVEAAILGARLAAGFGVGQGLAFLPLTLTGFSALTATGPAEHRLSSWITGAHQATLSALLMLKRLSDWKAGAGEATADLSGRTLARLITCLARWPLVSAPLAEAETGASRAAVQRNLDLLVARGLVREVTGQGRYRVWAAGV
ncbi:MAG: helix-turn-helix domain-containing protein, partial [Paracoccaceae bacterium]